LRGLVVHNNNIDGENMEYIGVAISLAGMNYLLACNTTPELTREILLDRVQCMVAILPKQQGESVG
jgi:hypothetical protein